MKKRLLFKLGIVGLAMAILIPMITYGDNSTSNFFTSDKAEAAANETVTMKLNLSEVQYDEFTFTLTSNESLEEVTSNAPTESGGNTLTISGKKSELNMNSISLAYVVPEDAEEGSTITFSAKVVSKETVEVESVSEELENEIESSNVVEEEVTATQESSMVITVIKSTKSDSIATVTTGSKDKEENDSSESEEKEQNEDTDKEKEIDKQTDEKDNKEKGIMEKEEMEKSGTDKDKMKKDDSEEDEKQEKTGSQKVSQTSTTTTTVTYNGDSNNYLSSLTIDGYELTPGYLKTSNTYFLTVGSEVDSLNVNAVAEDDDAQVTIYGNTNLQTGENKVLVSVTAENGDVKTYRIYVTKN